MVRRRACIRVYVDIYVYNYIGFIIGNSNKDFFIVEIIVFVYFGFGFKEFRGFCVCLFVFK